MTLLRYFRFSHLVSTVSVMCRLKITSTYPRHRLFTYCMGTVFHSADDFRNKHTFQTRFCAILHTSLAFKCMWRQVTRP